MHVCQVIDCSNLHNNETTSPKIFSPGIDQHRSSTIDGVRQVYLDNSTQLFYLHHKFITLMMHCLNIVVLMIIYLLRYQAAMSSWIWSIDIFPICILISVWSSYIWVFRVYSYRRAVSLIRYAAGIILTTHCECLHLLYSWNIYTSSPSFLSGSSSMWDSYDSITHIIQGYFYANVPVPMKKPWRIWIQHEQCQTTTKREPCANLLDVPCIHTIPLRCQYKAIGLGPIQQIQRGDQISMNHCVP